MNSCPYCGGSSELRRYQIDAPNCRQSLYRVTCTRCGASTEDSLAKSSVFSKWNRGEVLKMTVIVGWWHARLRMRPSDGGTRGWNDDLLP